MCQKHLSSSDARIARFPWKLLQASLEKRESIMKNQEKTELTIAKITVAAMDEFGRSGYTGGTINNICKTGINKGLIYHNFKDKDELYLFCLKKSCTELCDFLENGKCPDDPADYMKRRLEFFNSNPNEAHIFFEALLCPPPALQGRIQEELERFNTINDTVCQKALAKLTLRDGISKDDALSYVRQLQVMFNGYFSSPACRDISIAEKARRHEESMPKLLNFMLYGIAKDGRL